MANALIAKNINVPDNASNKQAPRVIYISRIEGDLEDGRFSHIVREQRCSSHSDIGICEWSHFRKIFVRNEFFGEYLSTSKNRDLAGRTPPGILNVDLNSNIGPIRIVGQDHNITYTYPSTLGQFELLRSLAVGFSHRAPLKNSDGCIDGDSRECPPLYPKATRLLLLVISFIACVLAEIYCLGKINVGVNNWWGFAGRGTFESHVSTTALVLKRTVEKLLAGLQASDPNEYRYLMQRSNGTSDFVQLVVAQTVRAQPMLGIIELRRNGAGNSLTLRTIICPGSCRQSTELFYLGYWEHIKPYVATSGRPRIVGSAASIDKLIRLEIQAHPNEVSVPINILEVNGSGARWLQNGGNCSLPGVGW